MIQTIISFVKKMPILSEIYRFKKKRDEVTQLRSMSAEELFTDVFKRKAWKTKESVSGYGSDLEQTEYIALELPKLFSAFNVSTLLDIPCGDFHWMNTVDLGDVKYIGADIVLGLILENKEKYKTNNIKFVHTNLIADELPKVDLIFCRDCLVHFSFKDIFRALERICNSGSTYLLTTTFPNRSKNRNIVTGRWRTLNFEKTPFNFPKPLQVINEHCEAEDGRYRDKSLGLWRIKDIQKCL